MRHTIFLTVCAVFYIGWIALHLRRLVDISNNPKKYDTIRGWDRYRESYWYEFGYQRYGKSYYASFYTGVAGWLLFGGAYWFLGLLIQKYLLIPQGTQLLGRTGLATGLLSAIFCGIGVSSYASFLIDWPIFVAARRYQFYYDKHFSLAWKKAVWLVLALSGLSLPVMFLGINASCYATEEAMVLRSTFSFEEQIIPYEDVVSAETGYSHDDRYREFDLRYTLTLEDGTQRNIMEFGSDGALYIDEQLRRQGIRVDYAELTPELYQAMRMNVERTTVPLLDVFFVVPEA